MVNYNLVTFTVSGEQFQADRRAILRHPTTSIAKLLQRYPQQCSFGPFRGCPKRFELIMEWYSTGKFYIPKELTRKEMVAEAKRYKIPFEKAPSNDHDFVPALLRMKFESTAQNLAGLVLERVVKDINGETEQEGYTDPAHRAKIQLADGQTVAVEPNALFFVPERACNCKSKCDHTEMTDGFAEEGNVVEHEKGCSYGEDFFKLLTHFSSTQCRELIARVGAILAPNNLKLDSIEQPFGQGGQLSFEYSFTKTEDIFADMTDRPDFEESDSLDLSPSPASTGLSAMSWASPFLGARN